MIDVFFMFENDDLGKPEKRREFLTDWEIMENRTSEPDIPELFYGKFREKLHSDPDKKIKVKIGRRIRLIRVNRISRIAAENHKLCIHMDGEEIYFCGKFDDIEEKLRQYKFVKINNYSLISLNHIKTAGKKQLEMEDGTRLAVGRKYAGDYWNEIEKISDLGIN